MKPLENDILSQKALRAKDLPESWNITIPGGPNTPVTVIVKKREPRKKRPLTSYIGAAKAAHSSAQQADEHVRQLRDEWES